MPGKKNTKDKKSQDATAMMLSHVEIFPSEVPQEKNAYTSALTRVDAVLSIRGGNPKGSIAELRVSHHSDWEELLREDHITRGQILELKSKENQVLGLIRDRVAENLMDTIDTAVEQGVLQAPEEV